MYNPAKVFMLVAALFVNLSVAAQANDAGSPALIKKKHGKILLFGPRSKSKKDVLAYVNARHKILGELNGQSPNNLAEAQVSFREYLDPGEMASFVKRNDLTVLALNFGHGEQVGGYELHDGEDIDSAINATITNHQAFIEELYESAHNQYEESVNRNMDREEIERLSGFIAHAKEQKTAFQKRGVRFYGARVRGKVATLERLKKHSQIIFLIDPLISPNADGETITEVRKIIAIPISPYDFSNR
jgi:FtsZ-binding cell division protein ZapB